MKKIRGRNNIKGVERNNARDIASKTGIREPER